MKSALIVLFVAICLWSLVTSFVAMVRIWTNPFKGSKVEWTVIVMIAFIGPALWLANGRKRIVKEA